MSVLRGILTAISCGSATCGENNRRCPKTAFARPKSKSSCERFSFSATLTRLDGTLVWRENEAENWIERNIAEENAADAWNKPGLANDVDKALSDRLVFRLFHGR